MAPQPANTLNQVNRVCKLLSKYKFSWWDPYAENVTLQSKLTISLYGAPLATVHVTISNQTPEFLHLDTVSSFYLPISLRMVGLPHQEFCL